MPWVKGQSGNPAGRKNEARFRNYLFLAPNEPYRPKHIPKLHVIADTARGLTCPAPSRHCSGAPSPDPAMNLNWQTADHYSFCFMQAALCN
jgi:hypothetical protein